MEVASCAATVALTSVCKNAPVSWIYFPALGGEATFVRVGVKTEFIAPVASGQDKGDMGKAHAPRGDVCWGEEIGRSSLVTLRLHAGRARNHRFAKNPD